MAGTPATFSADDMAGQSDSSLLALPAELRNRIYDLVFEDCIQDVTIRRPKSQTPSNLLLTCKQAYQEAIGIYYSNVVVSSTETSDLIHWIRSIPAERYCLVPELRYVFRAYTKMTEDALRREASFLFSAELQHTLQCEEIGTENKQLSVEIQKRRVSHGVC